MCPIAQISDDDFRGDESSAGSNPIDGQSDILPEPPMSATSGPQQASINPFDSVSITRMRLSQDFTELAAVRPAITTIAVRRPTRREFVRVRPGLPWRFETWCFYDPDNNEVYMVTPELLSLVHGEVKPTALVLAITRNSPIPFLWPLTLPSSDGRPNRWHESGIEAARRAESRWLRSTADMTAGCYVPFEAMGELPDPEWPAGLEMNDYIRLAFQGRLIDSDSHICLRRLRGEI